jgi:hypothetical protein
MPGTGTLRYRGQDIARLNSGRAIIDCAMPRSRKQTARYRHHRRQAMREKRREEERRRGSVIVRKILSCLLAGRGTHAVR